MASSTPANTAVTTAWSADIAAGTAALTIQLRDNKPVVVYVGAAPPAADSVDGMLLSMDGDRSVSLGAPIFGAGDKVFVRAPLGPSIIGVVKA